MQFVSGLLSFILIALVCIMIWGFMMLPLTNRLDKIIKLLEDKNVGT